MHLFVYGTLRPASGHPMARQLAAHATALGQGWMHGLLYDLGEYPGAIARPGSARVHGEIFEIADDSPLWAELDHYEDVRAGAASFERVVMPVWSDAAAAWIACCVYLYRGNVGRQPTIADGDWLDR
jgi:gamma-glutamylcyclotransferase (GGCT)/AIG2-like uncharacterized protein YtfP